MDYFGPIDEKTIALAEKKMKVKFPPGYRQFMLKHNGGTTNKPKPTYKINWLYQDMAKMKSALSQSDLAGLYAIMNVKGKVAGLVGVNVNDPTSMPKGTIKIGFDSERNLILLGVAGKYKGQVLFILKKYTLEAEKPDFDKVGVIAQNFEKFIK